MRKRHPDRRNKDLERAEEALKVRATKVKKDLEAEAKDLKDLEAEAERLRKKHPNRRNLERAEDLRRRVEALKVRATKDDDLKDLEAEAERLRRKRLGRPTKPPVSGQRVRLGLRVKSELKRALCAAAEASGRSVSQEAELRLENSLKSDSSLMLIQGHRATPVFHYENKLLVPVGYKAVAVEINFWDWLRVVNHFREQWYRGNVIDEEGNLATWEIVWEMRTELESVEGVSLGLRVTPDLKRALDHAAKEGEISQSLEAELRLENSLKSDEQLMLVQGHRATPITFDAGKMLIPITVEYGGGGPGPYDEYRLADETVALPISPKDQASIQSYFHKQWPKPHFDELVLDEEWAEIADYAAEREADLARGK